MFMKNWLKLGAVLGLLLAITLVAKDITIQPDSAQLEVIPYTAPYFEPFQEPENLTHLNKIIFTGQGKFDLVGIKDCRIVIFIKKATKIEWLSPSPFTLHKDESVTIMYLNGRYYIQVYDTGDKEAVNAPDYVR